MRIADWENRLLAVIEKHGELPSQFGVSDCFIIPDDAVEAVTGENMFPADARKYTTETGAAKNLRKYGFENVAQAFASKFEEIAPFLAQRGDIGIVERDGQFSGGVFTAVGFMTRGTDTVLFLPVTDVLRAFKVE